MSVEVREVSGKKEMKIFVQFANKLYQGNEYYCPTLDFDELGTFDYKTNPALDFCTYKCFLAWKDGKCVGRIAGIINPVANEKWNCKKLRFGWFDFIDDKEVSKALLDAALAWGKEQGMTEANGPVGFTDFDKEGLLIEGFEELAPMSTLHNYPYYEAHYEAYGLTKEVDWVELLCTVPDDLPEKWYRVAEAVSKRSKVHAVHVKNKRELFKRYPNQEYFKLLSEAYSVLYNYQPLTEKQMKYLADMYIPFLNFDLVCLVENEQNELVGLSIGIPDLTKALQKCNGSLFPFGWYHMLKALKAKQIPLWDFLLIAVRPDYQDKGINATIFADQMPYFTKYGIKQAETTVILEDNVKNLANFMYFEHRQHRRHRAYIKEIK